MNKWRPMLSQASLYTAVAINLMLVALIVGQNVVHIEQAVPSMAGTAQPNLRVEYVMEWAGRQTVPAETDGSAQGSWVVEHYKEYEYHYDKDGRLLEKRPTAKEEYIRYWKDTP